MLKHVLLIFLSVLFVNSATSQQRLLLHGKVVDDNHDPIELVTVILKNSLKGTTSDSNGNYELDVPKRDSIKVIFSRIGSATIEKTIFGLKNDTLLNIILPYTTKQIAEVSISKDHSYSANMERIDSKLASIVPDASGSGVEALIMTLPGVSSNNELSSQYSVRGGNFDENLVYVNDIEVYRPILIRSGQQEGLSFINPAMVASVAFSAGGFDAKYGDKMSSVLDIKYRRPTEAAASFSASMLGLSANAESASKNKKFTQLHGLRYRTSEYLLGTLDTKAEYNPSFLDYQTYLTYQVSPKLELSFLGNVSQNTYQFRPQTRSTQFGTYKIARALTVYFDGWENDKFQTALGALSMSYRASENSSIRLTSSVFTTNESESYDISGEYWLNELDNQIGSETFGDSVRNIGVGAYLQHARNKLSATVISFDAKGIHEMDEHTFQWGATVKNEKIDDNINEWELRDSAGYSLPPINTQSSKKLELFSTYRTEQNLSSQRFNAYVQDNYRVASVPGELNITAGVRASYWTLNEEFLFSPRAAAYYIPDWDNKAVFKVSSGIYYQAPFYKELRKRDGSINPNIKSQRSIHYLAGADFYFKKWERPFKFTTEIYYKSLSNLIPYDIDNVQIRYYGDNMAKGYATGLDLRLYGEFVPGVDSWISFSLLKSEEDLLNDSYTKTTDEGISTTYYPGYVPRPSDQRYNFSIFFQDYFPGNPNYKLHLRGLLGSKLPFGPPNGEKYQMNFRMPPYHRVDIGLSRFIAGSMSQGFLKNFKELWLGFEVYNMFDVNNVNSYFWVSDVSGDMYAVPNYLTGRRFNLNITAKF